MQSSVEKMTIGKHVVGKEIHDGTQFYLSLVEYFLLTLNIIFSDCNYCYEQ